MANGFNMGEAIRPLFISGNNNSYSFAGTGVFITHNDLRLLVTANHVLGDNELFVYAVPQSGNGFEITEALNPTKLITKSEKNDLAILEVPNFNPGLYLALASEIPAPNIRIGTLEYSRFEINPHERLINPNPSTRIGNIVRFLNNNDKRFPEGTLELSYPALQGASGSPVITLEGLGETAFQVCGIVVANAQYELMPVQTYKYRDMHNNEEEMIHYYLPAGIAIHVHWLKELIATIPD